MLRGKVTFDGDDEGAPKAVKVSKGRDVDTLHCMIAASKEAERNTAKRCAEIAEESAEYWRESIEHDPYTAYEESAWAKKVQAEYIAKAIRKEFGL